jgi:hypothetical protein
VAALTQRPGMAPILLPMLRQSLMSWIEIAGPKLEEVARKERKFEEQYGTRIDDMINYFLSALPGATNATNPATNNHADPAPGNPTVQFTTG